MQFKTIYNTIPTLIYRSLCGCVFIVHLAHGTELRKLSNSLYFASLVVALFFAFAFCASDMQLLCPHPHLNEKPLHPRVG